MKDFFNKLGWLGIGVIAFALVVDLMAVMFWISGSCDAATAFTIAGAFTVAIVVLLWMVIKG